jgi:hypothetical protein
MDPNESIRARIAQTHKAFLLSVAQKVPSHWSPLFRDRLSSNQKHWKFVSIQNLSLAALNASQI